jgi:exosome complex component RRP42
MAPSSAQQVLLSPAELSYLHTSLSSSPPIRPDARTPSQFRPLVAETDILPGTNGSARICFADGTEAIVGIKAEVEKSRPIYQQNVEDVDLSGGAVDDDEDGDEGGGGREKGLNEWVELSVEIPGFRDDDSMPVFLSAMLSEALLADGEFTERLWINRRFHWKLYLDVSLLDPLYYQVTDFTLDFVAFAATVLPPSSPISHHTPRPPFNSPTET